MPFRKHIKAKFAISRSRSAVASPSPSPPSSCTPQAGASAPPAQPLQNDASPTTLEDSSITICSISTTFWRTAFNALSESDQAVLKPYALPHVSDINSALDTILQSAREKQEICQARKWEISVGKHKIVLRDQAEKLVGLLDKFKQVGDVAVNADPIHAGLPWAGIRVIIQLLVSDQEQMNALLNGLELVFGVLERCRIYTRLYFMELSAELAQKNLERVLAEMYTLVLHFLASAIRLCNKTYPSRILHAFWSLDEMTKFVQKSEVIENRVEMEASNYERVLTHANRVEVKEHLNNLAKRLDDMKELNSIWCGTHEKLENIWNYLEQERLTKILQWTSSIPFEDDHETAKRGRVKFTGQWIFEREEYKRWGLQQPKGSILWLHGNVGAGKTKLTSLVIDHFRDQGNVENQGLAYFYCNRADNSRRAVDVILRSFIKQLAKSPTGQKINKGLLESYTRKESSGWASNQISVEEAETLMLDMAQPYIRVILVLDALDECEELTRANLIDIFCRLAEKEPKFQMFISSRRNEDIKKQLKKETCLGIDATDNAQDISKFVFEKLEEDRIRRERQGTLLSVELTKEIAKVLLTQSDGMFQWAGLQISRLLRLSRESDIRAFLRKLPKGLKETYDVICKEIMNQDGSMPIIAKRTFQWMVAAGSRYPFSNTDLIVAVCQDPDKDEIVLPDFQDIGIIIDACQNLIVNDGHYCRFAHLSVEEYLEDHSPWSGSILAQSHELIANICLITLNFYDSDEHKPGFELPYTLLMYFRRDWSFHTKKVEIVQGGYPPRLMYLLKKFLGQPENASQAYIAWGRHQIGQYWQYVPYSTPVIYLCKEGLRGMLVEWGDAFSPNIMNKEGNSLLALASNSGHLDIVEYLLSRGAKVNALLNGSFGSALGAAIQGDALDAALLLLNSGADVNMPLDTTGGCVLADAAYHDKTEMMQFLLDHGADVNVDFRSYFGSPLAAASGSMVGSLTPIHILLQHGADVNAQLKWGFYGSALAAASRTGSSSGAVKLLLDLGADVNLPGSSALAEAVNSGDIELIHFLLEVGADPNQQSKIRETPLSLAKQLVGYPNIVQLLVDHGATAE